MPPPDLASLGGYAARFTSNSYGLGKSLAGPAAAAEPLRWAFYQRLVFSNTQK